MESSAADKLSPVSQELTNMCQMVGGKGFSNDRKNDIERNWL